MICMISHLQELRFCSLEKKIDELLLSSTFGRIETMEEEIFSITGVNSKSS